MKNIKSLVKSALILGIACLIAQSTASKAFAQATEIWISEDVPQEVNLNEAVSLPVMLSTDGENIDGVQVELEFSSAVEDIDVKVENSLGLQILTQAKTANGYSVMLVPTDPTDSIMLIEDTLLFELTYTPVEAGDLLVTFIKEGTLAPSSENSEDVLQVVNGYQTYVLDAMKKDTIMDDAELGGLGDDEVTLPVSMLLIPTFIAIILIAGGAMMMMKKKDKKSEEMTRPMPTPTDLPGQQ